MAAARYTYIHQPRSFKEDHRGILYNVKRGFECHLVLTHFGSHSSTRANAHHDTLRQHGMILGTQPVFRDPHALAVPGLFPVSFGRLSHYFRPMLARVKSRLGPCVGTRPDPTHLGMVRVGSASGECRPNPGRKCSDPGNGSRWVVQKKKAGGRGGNFYSRGVFFVVG
jgi:hypothetical protein